MSYRITDEFQPECDTIKRSTIHCCYKNLDQPIDAIAFDTSTAPSVVEDVLKGPLRRPNNPKYLSENVTKDPSVAQRALSVPFRKVTPFQCLYSAKYIGDTYLGNPSLMFANGPEDAEDPDTIMNFIRGFVGPNQRDTFSATVQFSRLPSIMSLFLISSFGTRIYLQNAAGFSSCRFAKTLARASTSEYLQSSCNIIANSFSHQ